MEIESDPDRVVERTSNFVDKWSKLAGGAVLTIFAGASTAFGLALHNTINSGVLSPEIMARPGMHPDLGLAFIATGLFGALLSTGFLYDGLFQKQ